MTMVEAPLAAALQGKSVLICVGAGGVGKTTVSATLALRAAALGRSALVCTIDPARRLANSLGLAELGNAEARIPADRWKALGVEPKAPLHAMMLDMKQSWDELIQRYASPEKQAAILENRFYRALSSALAGSQEYIALEKLWQLRSQRDYALIVLDTPPTAHALDFLDAPNRILDFLDNEAAKWLLTPALAAGRMGLQLFNLGGSYAAKTLARFTGAETLQELATFMQAISGMNQGFRERARSVRDLLAADATGFVVVTSPARERMDEAVHFWELLRENKMNVVAVVVNRVHAPVAREDFEAAQGLASPLREKVLQTLEEAQMLARADAEGIAELTRRCSPSPMVTVPRFEWDVHDLTALWRTGDYLLGHQTLRADASFG